MLSGDCGVNDRLVRNVSWACLRAEVRTAMSSVGVLVGELGSWLEGGRVIVVGIGVAKGGMREEDTNG